MAVFNEHRPKHNNFVFPTSCKHSKEMPLTKIVESKLKSDKPLAHPPAAQPSSFQEIRRFPPLPYRSLEFIGILTY
jgi:hypothetical protein